MQFVEKYVYAKTLKDSFSVFSHILLLRLKYIEFIYNSYTLNSVFYIRVLITIRLKDELFFKFFIK